MKRSIKNFKRPESAYYENHTLQSSTARLMTASNDFDNFTI